MNKPRIGFKTKTEELVETLQSENTQLKVQLAEALKANEKLQAHVVELESVVEQYKPNVAFSHGHNPPFKGFPNH